MPICVQTVCSHERKESVGGVGDELLLLAVMQEFIVIEHLVKEVL